MNLHDELFELSTAVRYVAIAIGSKISLHERPGISNSSGSESDRYEELLVNPAIILLTQRRGEIDCGGLEYILVRYGNFYQLIHPAAGGHVSVAIEPNSNVEETVHRICGVIRQSIATWQGKTS